MSFTANGIVSLLTDFGARDAYVGTLKAVLLREALALRAAEAGRAPAAAPPQIVDLVHELPPQDVRAAAFHLAHAWHWFPPGTVHVAVVDPGVGSARPILCAEHQGHVFLAPDNGLLGPILGTGSRVRALELERFSLPHRSRTFHGRDVFAPAAARLACGMRPELAGPALESWRSFAFPRARALEPGLLEVEIVLADRYGNLVTNARGADLAPDPARWEALVGTRRIPVLGTYAEAAPGDALCLIDSYDLLEIAVRDGDAQAELGLGAGAALRLRCGA